MPLLPLSHIGHRSLRSERTQLRSGRRLASPSCGLLDKAASMGKKARHGAQRCSAADLPTDLVCDILALLDAKELAALSCTAKWLRKLSTDEARWAALARARFGASALLDSAAKVAGGYRVLYAELHSTERDSAPWRKLCRSEKRVAVERLLSERTIDGLCVTFLVDGSGSVTEDDFETMKSFIRESVTQLAVEVPDLMVCLVQFSNSVRVELAPAPYDAAAFGAALDSMVRMNGGTNIALSIGHAGQLLKQLPGQPGRALAFLTDGRVDSYQAREALEIAQRLADEQACVSLHAYGVGRGVDKEELLRILAATQPETAEHRYYDLCVTDDAPW